METFDWLRLHTVGKQVIDFQTTENPSEPEFPVILMPWFPCWAAGGVGR